MQHEVTSPVYLKALVTCEDSSRCNARKKDGNGRVVTAMLISIAMINISCKVLTVVFITFYWTRVCVLCSGDAEMSSQADILKAFDDALKPRNAAALVGHWASTVAWLTELKHRGISNSVTEMQLNSILKQHPIHGPHLKDPLTKREVRVTTARKGIVVTDNDGKITQKSRQVFYYVCSHKKLITVPFTVPTTMKHWQQVYDKTWHRTTVEREMTATTAVTRTPEPDETQNSPTSEDTAQLQDSAHDDNSRKSRKVDSLESKVARNFLNIPAGNVRTKLDERIDLLIDVATM